MNGTWRRPTRSRRRAHPGARGSSHRRAGEESKGREHRGDGDGNPAPTAQARSPASSVTGRTPDHRGGRVQPAADAPAPGRAERGDRLLDRDPCPACPRRASPGAGHRTPSTRPRPSLARPAGIPRPDDRDGQVAAGGKQREVVQVTLPGSRPGRRPQHKVRRRAGTAASDRRRREGVTGQAAWRTSAGKALHRRRSAVPCPAPGRAPCGSQATAPHSANDGRCFFRQTPGRAGRWPRHLPPRK